MKSTVGMQVMVVMTVLAMSATAALGAPASASWLANTEKLHVEKTGGGKFGKANYALAEFTGAGGLTETTETGSSFLDSTFRSVKQKYETRFTVVLPGQTEPVAVTCNGGQARSDFKWVTFKRSKLAYHCDYIGGGAPAGASLDLVLSEPGIMKSIEQPQRAGEFTFGNIVLKAETRQVDTQMIASPGVLGYVFSREGVDVAGISFVGWKKTIYLPKPGDLNRTASALLALSLYYFNDPGNL
jgi:hypothetical protein